MDDFPPMPDPAAASTDPGHPRGDDRLEMLVALAHGVVERQQDDPFGNPVLAMALLVSRRLDEGALSLEDIDHLVRQLRDDAFLQRAERLGRYVGVAGARVAGGGDMEARLRRIAARLIRPDPDDSPVPLAQFRAAVQRVRYAAVFTAHPTFALATEAYAALAASASGSPCLPSLASQRPALPTLEDEFQHAVAAILRGRDAIDKLNEALLREAASYWPQAWSTLSPCPLILSS